MSERVQRPAMRPLVHRRPVSLGPVRISQMIGGKHIQRGTNRVLTYAAFHPETGPRISIFATIFEGDRLLGRPDFDLPYQP